MFFLTTRKDLPTVVRLTGTHSPQPLVKQQNQATQEAYTITLGEFCFPPLVNSPPARQPSALVVLWDYLIGNNNNYYSFFCCCLN